MDKIRRDKLLKMIYLALEKGATGKEIEPTRKGRSISTLKKSPEKIYTMKERKLIEIEKQVNKILKENKVHREKKTQKAKAKITKPKLTKSISRKVDDLAKRVTILEEENQKLKKLLAIEKNRQITKVNNDLYGFSLQLRKTSGKDGYWYAGKSIGGKLKWVYVGKDRSKAKQKIEAWLAKAES